METSSIEYAAYIGLDWADREHAWCLHVPGHTALESGFVAQTPEAIEQWVAALVQRFQGRPIAIALEQSRGALLFALTKYEHLILYPIHPARLAHYRKSFRPSGAKDDPSDAELLLNYLSNHRDQLRPLQPDTEDTRALQFLVEARRRIIDDKTRFKNRLTAVLKQYYPQILDWFADVDSAVVIDLLERWSTLEDLQGVPRSTLGRFLKQHRCGGLQKLEERCQQIQSAVPATKDSAVLKSFSLTAKCLVRLLREMRSAVEAYDQTIEELAKKHPDFDLFQSFPGAGNALVPRLIAAFGSQRDRWANASELQCYTGIAPVLETSGRQKWVHVRWACPKFVRQTFHEWALHSLKKCSWAKEHYKSQLDRGKSRHAAIRAVAFKWLRIAFRCWTNRSRYDSALCLQRRSIRASCATDLEIQWKTCGSFSKLAAVVLATQLRCLTTVRAATVAREPQCGYHGFLAFEYMPQLIFSSAEPRVLVLAVLSTSITAYLLTLRNKTRDLRVLLAAFTCWSVYFLISVGGEAVYPKSAWYPIAEILAGLLGLAALLEFAYDFLGTPYPTEARLAAKVAALVVAVCGLILMLQMLTHKPVTWSVGSGASLLLFAWAETVFVRRSRSGKTKRECTAHRQFAAVFLLSALAVAVYFLRDMGEVQPGAVPLISSLLYLCTLLGFALVYVNHAPQPTTFQVKIIGVSLFTMLAVLTIVCTGLSPALNEADDLDLATRLELQKSIVPSIYAILGSTAFILLAFPKFFRRSLINPLNALLGAVDQVNQGARDVQVPVLFNDEIGRLTANFNRMTQSLKEAEHEIRIYTESLEAKVQERTAELRIRNEDNERLLLNILPPSIAERLKRGEGIIADTCSEATILFADIVGFTNLSTHLPAGELVSLLSDLFSEFDELAQRYGVEKIKTIGDAYMAVAGLPESRPDHAAAAIHLAERMLQVCQQRRDKDGNALQLRIGINSGPVIAGVIGAHKFAYDLWGDAVNTASRMESHGKPGRIQVTEATRALLQDQYEFEACGEQQIKGKGLMATYLVSASRSATSTDV